MLFVLLKRICLALNQEWEAGLMTKAERQSGHKMDLSLQTSEMLIKIHNLIFEDC